MKRFTLIAGLIVALVLGTGTMAVAADPSGPEHIGGLDKDGPRRDFRVGGPERKCDVWTNPSPQYSASNRTLHFGALIQCTFTDSLVVIAQLYRVTGSGSNQEFWWEDSRGDAGVAQVLGTPQDPDLCLTTTPTRWKLFVRGSAASLGEASGWSSEFTLPCGEVV